MDNLKSYFAQFDTKKKRIALVAAGCFFLFGGLVALFYYLNLFHDWRKPPLERVLFLPFYAMSELGNGYGSYSWRDNFSCYFLSILSLAGFASCLLYAFHREDNWIGKLIRPFKILIGWVKKGS